MTTSNITNHTELRLALEDQTIDSIQSTSYDVPGFSSLSFTLRDGTTVYLDTVVRNGGAYITVDVR